jgi:bifunctional non-homologous end joining protein LigD
MSKARRKGRIFIDFFRNTRGATFIAPYSTRARENAPVATPLAWDELSPKISANQFTIRNVTQRLERLARDPWANMGRVKQSISAAMLREFGVR